MIKIDSLIEQAESRLKVVEQIDDNHVSIISKPKKKSRKQECCSKDMAFTLVAKMIGVFF